MARQLNFGFFATILATAIGMLIGIAVGVPRPSGAGSSGGARGAAGITQGYLVGCTVSASGDESMIVGPGVARDKNDAVTITFASAVTITNVNQAFDSATGGGLDTGTTLDADSWYYVHLTNHATSSFLLSLSITSPTLPSGVTTTRWIGCARADASGDWIQCQSNGGVERAFQYRNENTNSGVPRVLSAGAATSYTDVDCSNVVPPESNIALFHVRPTDNNFMTVNSRGQSVDHNRITNANGTTGGKEREVTLFVDQQQIVRYRVSAVDGNLIVLEFELQCDGSE